ncbi:MAG TPA: enoyl-CoA hydratase/isomerase family protein [Acidimicrobiales bacterium]|nr:enoyl-CoA hydratase/isomerase family protein [Acidimicrobiales bacterium]
MADYETLLYEETEGVAWVTLNRPERLNAFNIQMQRDLQTVWRALRRNDDVRCVVLTGAGDRAFCTGIDREETMGAGRDDRPEEFRVGSVGTPFQFDDPGHVIGPKTNDLWKPVIAAVRGMACGGAFYLLGECEFLIASDDATFFDPHVTYGMIAAFEPTNMLHLMPFPEIMRLSLLGAHERMSAQRAHQIGMVSEVVPADELRDAAQWVASRIASQPTLPIQGTVRNLWHARDMNRSQALAMAYAMVGLGTDQASIDEGQRAFSSGKRVDWKLR